MLGRLNEHLVNLREELRRSVPREERISLGWANVITYLLLIVDGDTSGEITGTMTSDLIDVFYEYLEYV